MTPLIAILINLIILLLVLAVFYWIVTLIVTHLGGPSIVLTIAQVLLALILLIWLIQVLSAGAPHWRFF